MWPKIVSYIPDWTIFMQAAITLLFPVGIFIFTGICIFMLEADAPRKQRPNHRMRN